MKHKILIIEDCDDIFDIYEDTLGPMFEITRIESLSVLEEYFNNENKEKNFTCFELALVDINLADGNILEFIEEKNLGGEFSSLKKIFVSSEASDISTIEKADKLATFDFMAKPFTPPLLQYKIEKLLKSREAVVFNAADHTVTYKDIKSQILTSTEYGIVGALAEFNAVTLADLIQSVWGEKKENQKVAVHISRLRKKISPIGLEIIHIKETNSYMLRAIAIASKAS